MSHTYHTKYWKGKEKERIEKSKTFKELGIIALDIINGIKGEIHMVSGPISTGGVGTVLGNKKIFEETIERLIDQGFPIFSQIPFENKIHELHIQWQRNNPTESYCTPILNDFYEPIFSSGKIEVLHFIHDWQSSRGARWENENCDRWGIERRYLPENKTELMRIIRDEILVLDKSPLYKYRTENKFFPVIGEGSHNARIVFVGEAPGRNEAKTGKPFCGAAGKVLDQLLEHIKIPRNSVYITNIVKDRPPENRDPTDEEISVYGPFLDRQIDIIQPEIIVALGRYSMGYIMKKFNLESELLPISKMHGRSFKAKASYGNINIVIQYHPCVGVYNPNNIPTLKKDMEILKTL